MMIGCVYVCLMYHRIQSTRILVLTWWGKSKARPTGPVMVASLASCSVPWTVPWTAQTMTPGSAMRLRPWWARPLEACTCVCVCVCVCVDGRLSRAASQYRYRAPRPSTPFITPPFTHRVGACDGAFVGLGDGLQVGSRVGVDVGLRVGACDGPSDGASDGACDGASEGALLGCKVDAALDAVLEGADEGCVLGASDGCRLGAFVGCVVGSLVGERDGALQVQYVSYQSN